MTPTTPWPVRHLSISIARSPADVYEVAADPQNLPRWAQGLAGASVRRHGDAWVTSSPMGEITFRFAPRNTFGVLDHDVTLPTGETVHNPMRVVPNGGGSEVIFTLFRRPGMTDDEIERDVAAVDRDLRALKTLIEG